MIHYSSAMKVLFLISGLAFSSAVLAEADDFLKKDVIENKSTSEQPTLESKEQEVEENEDVIKRIDEKQIEKWINEVKGLKKEYQNLYNIIDENKSSPRFQSLGISSLPSNYVNRYENLMENMLKLPEENPFKSQLADSFNLDNLAMIYLENNSKIPDGSDDAAEVAKLIKRKIMELYSKKDFYYRPHIDPYYLNSEEYINDIVDRKKTDKLTRVWKEIKVDEEDSGFSLDKETWEKEHTLTASNLYDGVFLASFTPVFDGKKDIQRIFDLKLNESEFEHPKTEKELLKIVKELVPKDSNIEYFYKKSSVDSSRYYSWENVIVFKSNIVGERFKNLNPDSVDFGQLTSFFQVEYDFYDYDPVTDKKASDVVSLRIRHISKE